MSAHDGTRVAPLNLSARERTSWTDGPRRSCRTPRRCTSCAVYARIERGQSTRPGPPSAASSTHSACHSPSSARQSMPEVRKSFVMRDVPRPSRLACRVSGPRDAAQLSRSRKQQSGLGASQEPRGSADNRVAPAGRARRLDSRRATAAGPPTPPRRTGVGAATGTGRSR
jgi:hypothetical protein